MIQKFPLFFNVYTIENVNEGGLGVKKRQNLINIVCERSLILNFYKKVLFFGKSRSKIQNAIQTLFCAKFHFCSFWHNPLPKWDFIVVDMFNHTTPSVEKV